MKSLEEILKEEEILRKGKELYYCLCYATTGKICTVCKCHMDMDHDSHYASCDPSCKIANMSKNQLIELAHANSVKTLATQNKREKFITFTRRCKAENDYIRLFKVLDYLKKSKAVEQFWYSFEFQKNGNPHLHTIIHMKTGKYFRDIKRTLESLNDEPTKDGHIDEQPQLGTMEQGFKYLTKDIVKTQDFIKDNGINYFLLYNIPLTNVQKTIQATPSPEL